MYHSKTVADPQTLPAARTVRDFERLAVDGNDVGWSFANDASTDVLSQFLFGYRHHRQRRRGTQPVRLVRAGRVITHIVNITEHEWHRAEFLET